MSSLLYYYYYYYCYYYYYYYYYSYYYYYYYVENKINLIGTVMCVVFVSDSVACTCPCVGLLLELDCAVLCVVTLSLRVC